MFAYSGYFKFLYNSEYLKQKYIRFACSVVWHSVKSGEFVHGLNSAILINQSISQSNLMKEKSFTLEH